MGRRTPYKLEIWNPHITANRNHVVRRNIVTKTCASSEDQNIDI